MPDASAVSIVADTLRNSVVMANFPADWPEKTAKAVVDALGGLTRAWAAVLPDDSYFTPYHEGHEFHPGEAREQAVADVAEYEDSRL
ncbi:MAG: hypothetical protein ABFE07_04080, partial [Armatimonadia bacterium]